MAVNVGNPLIAALRGATAPQGVRPSGPQALNFAWQSNSEGPLVLPNRSVTRPTVTRPTQPAPRPAAPVVPQVPGTNLTFNGKSTIPPDFANLGQRIAETNANQQVLSQNSTVPQQQQVASILPAGENRLRASQPDVPSTPEDFGLIGYADPTPPAPTAPRRPVSEPDVRLPLRKVNPETSVRQSLEQIVAREEPPPPAPAPEPQPMPVAANTVVADEPSVREPLEQFVPRRVTTPAPAPVPAPAPAPAPVAAPVTDEVSVRRTLEQILADSAPQVVTPPPAQPLPPEVNIPAFDSGINFQMPDFWFSMPAPFVEGFTPPPDVAAAMEAQGTLPAPAATPAPEPQYIDPGLLAMLQMPQAPQPVQQPVREEPVYADMPWWMMDGGFDLR